MISCGATCTRGFFDNITGNRTIIRSAANGVPGGFVGYNFLRLIGASALTVRVGKGFRRDPGAAGEGMTCLLLWGRSRRAAR